MNAMLCGVACDEYDRVYLIQTHTSTTPSQFHRQTEIAKQSKSQSQLLYFSMALPIVFRVWAAQKFQRLQYRIWLFAQCQYFIFFTHIDSSPKHASELDNGANREPIKTWTTDKLFMNAILRILRKRVDTALTYFQLFYLFIAQYLSHFFWFVNILIFIHWKRQWPRRIIAKTFDIFRNIFIYRTI